MAFQARIVQLVIAGALESLPVFAVAADGRRVRSTAWTRCRKMWNLSKTILSAAAGTAANVDSM